MIYLLGVDHKIQHDGPLGPQPEHTEMFVDAVSNIIEDLSIEVIVEEFNEDAKRLNEVTKGVVEKIAAVKNIRLIYCEPSKEERERNGILTEPQIFKKLGFDILADLTTEQRDAVDEKILKQFEIREALWYDTAKDVMGSTVLCIIGARHVPTFGKLLREKGHEYAVISENWCLENFT